ncbi:T9SS type A sorting domain-containing protein [Flavobacterium subsaxonicum]|uniref:Secretion system C-terminal sorting domain-containing protein n=1 Tax=Flavobacterium subsaxonicum WB 4.1-42 = DSM 21790 TaxID=1121898 RepID=A0A0A2MST5_9FLAO|nr:T9SS type A sorting domain-containing protein [Flavobacterium subsaxonicum]KGO91290.1 hypothetical protein Q766_18610 [Flavobacterium subsaxonicum WB 4.1-42 = DSM 21790]
MKKIILLLALAIGSFAQAQEITVNTQGNGGTINNGDTFTYTTLWSTQAESLGKIPFTVTNNTAAPINVQVRIDQIENADGSNVQMCFGVCLATIEVGEFYPGFNYTIEANETSQAGDHFANGNAGVNTTAEVKYRLTFVKMNEDGTPISDLLTFNYIYSPTAGVGDVKGLQNIGINLSNTVVKNQIDITATTAATMELFNLNGQVLKTVSVKEGSQSIEASFLSTGVYVAKFTTTSGKSSTIKLVKN